MKPTLRHATVEYVQQSRADEAAMLLDVRAWTGRSALTSATTTALPHFATAGTRRTRVSEMRLSAPETSRGRSDGVGRSQGNGGMMRRWSDGTSADRG